MIRNALDDDNFPCGIFIYLQKVFETVNLDILLSKLIHYSIRGVAFHWFKSYLSNRTQYAIINNERLKSKPLNMMYQQAPSYDPYYFSYT